MSKAKTFEEKMQRLEDIVAAMGRPEVSLSESVKLYKEGIALTQSLENELEKIENSVYVLIKNAEGHITKEYDEQGI